ncbi:hypothetical protein HAX54_010545 [Datura stramonium]|uniref:Uncharacterized protein n=1 Tax=Datura stramonium TaxID=4076 RepID=A0ABS8TGH6_DATST|nr:hypothetical protein [Datura stramonium]
MEMEINRHDEGEILKDHGGSLRVQLERRCMEEVEKVLEEFSQKGEFAFGSFWGVDEDENSGSSDSRTYPLNHPCGTMGRTKA